eukprot:EG_transcript_20530
MACRRAVWVCLRRPALATSHFATGAAPPPLQFDDSSPALVKPLRPKQRQTALQPTGEEVFRTHFDVANEFNLSDNARQPATQPVTKRQRRMRRLRLKHDRLRDQTNPAVALAEDPSEQGGVQVSDRARALIHAALRGRQGFVGKGAVFPVALESTCTHTTATTPDNLAKMNFADRTVTLHVPINGLGLSLQGKRRMAAMVAPAADGLISLTGERYLAQHDNERWAKSVLVQLVNEAAKADQGPEQWAEAVVKVPLHATQLKRLERVTKEETAEEGQAQELLRKWAQARKESAVPIFADSLYTAYKGDKTI